MRRLQVRKALEEQYKYEQVAGTRRPRGDAVHDQRFYVGRALRKKLEAEDVVAAGRVGAATGVAVAPAIGAARAKEAATVGAVAPEEAVRPCLAEEGCAGPRAGCTTEATPVEAVARTTRAARVMRAFAASSQSRALCPTT